MFPLAGQISSLLFVGLLVLCSFFFFFSPHLVYFWSGNPVLLRLACASLPWEFSVLSFVPFFHHFLVPWHCPWLRPPCSWQHLLQGSADVTRWFFLQFPCLEPLDFRSMCVQMRYRTDSGVNTSDVHRPFQELFVREHTPLPGTLLWKCLNPKNKFS